MIVSSPVRTGQLDLEGNEIVLLPWLGWLSEVIRVPKRRFEDAEGHVVSLPGRRWS